MEKVINQIKAFFDEGSWKYKYYEDKKAFKTIVSMGNSLGDLIFPTQVCEMGGYSQFGGNPCSGKVYAKLCSLTAYAFRTKAKQP